MANTTNGTGWNRVGAQRTGTQRPRSAPRAGANGSQTKVNNKTFSPGFTLNVNAGGAGNSGGRHAAPAGGGQGGGRSQSLLPAPEFTSPAQVRQYCNAVRAAGVALSIEVAMGAEILKATLVQVPDPDGRIGGSRFRAAKVARKMQRAADALRDAAKNAAATYALFQQEYEEEINRVRHRARKPSQPRMDWGQL
ncbi:plasmid transfer protein TraA [Streptomyces sp. NBC_00320]|uniref:plasmid transfer protein TraA n=1 Tax=Streptomyces sp. NBC_00320 TaxID=2975711 RepID=UPI00225AB251|nr:plasmid transfer protein TraA [Streptomyces sp. NBC_00320]MCX5147931.1 plasmid transfer protein TraA [Streptomyces sp. NBC_00320]